MLELNEVSYERRGRKLIEGVSLSFQTGKCYAILGPNGAGKSTLLKSIAGIWPATEGEVVLDGECLDEMSRQEISRKVGFVPQVTSELFPFTVAEMVEMGLYGDLQLPRNEWGSAVEDVLRQVDAWHLVNKRITELSTGEQKRVFIARALVTRAPILLFDEPNTGLDIRHQLEIWELLVRLSRQGHLVLASVHDLTVAERFFDEVVVMQQGCCVGTGLYREVMTEEMIVELFGVRQCESTGSVKWILG